MITFDFSILTSIFRVRRLIVGAGVVCVFFLTFILSIPMLVTSECGFFTPVIGYGFQQRTFSILTV